MQIIELLNKCFNHKMIPRSYSSYIVPCCNYDSKIIAYVFTKTKVNKTVIRKLIKLKAFK